MTKPYSLPPENEARSIVKMLTPHQWLVLASVVATVIVIALPPTWFSDIDNSKPISSYLSVDQIPAEKRPQIVVQSRRDTDRGSTEITFLLINNSPSPIYYPGYTPESFSPRMPVGDISPLYAKKAKPADDWEAKRIGWCGTGAGRMRLLPGHAGRFVAFLHQDEREIKIGVYSSKSDASQFAENDIIWSSPISLPE